MGAAVELVWLEDFLALAETRNFATSPKPKVAAASKCEAVANADRGVSSVEFCHTEGAFGSLKGIKRTRGDLP